MENLIPIMNKVQDILSALGTTAIKLDLPQIVVVGSQSSGKSSVLESIVGRDFLPRGNDVCTRCPMILQLLNSHKDIDHGIFLHSPEKKFYNFDDIKSEITRQTEKLNGNNKGISSKPIRLKIFSKNVVNLTLVDLPGITKVAIGDQPDDIESKLRAIVRTYASNPNSLILAIIPGNADIATSDALQIAKELDPQSNRTIGVLTKIDLMDKGQSVKAILAGKVFPLKHSYVAVRNRSQLEIEENVPIDIALENEKSFFLSNPFYKNMKSKLGIPYLRTCLNKILVEHLKLCLPNLKHHIRKLRYEIEKELENMGFDTGEDKPSQSKIILSVISKFSRSFIDIIDGKRGDLAAQDEIFGGAKISKIFHHVFARAVNSIDPFEHLSDREIALEIKNSTGTKPSLFVPEIAFETLSKRQIMRLKKPAVECVEMVFNELMKVSRNCDSEAKRYRKFHCRILDCVSDLLAKHKKPALEMVKRVIDIEMAYINTNHPDFIGGSNVVPGALAKVKGRRRKIKENGESISVEAETKCDSDNEKVKEKIEIEIIKRLISSYFKITRVNVADSVPKTIMHFLVNKTKEELQSSLVSALYRPDLFDALLEENKEIASERARNKDMLAILDKATEIIESVSEFSL